VKLGAGAALGEGDQWMPWIHLRDLVQAYVLAIGNEQMEGAFNASAGAATNREFMATAAKVLDKPFFLPAVPSFALRIALGEMSDVLLKGSRVDNSKLLAHGFVPEHVDLTEALSDLLAD
jgi:uncharacterized protein